MPEAIFISYRREDTGQAAAGLKDALDRRLGAGSVFLDHDSIDAGSTFPPRLESAVRDATVVLVLIGKGWLQAHNEHGIRRLDLPTDWVRLEIETALNARKVVVPVLIDGAPSPPKAAFVTTSTLAPLADIHGFRFSSENRHQDTERLMTFLDQHGVRVPASPPEKGLQKRPGERVLVFLSAGGTCRDPMAKAIMLKLLKERPAGYDLRIEAMGLYGSDGQKASRAARQVIREMYQEDLLRDHVTQRINDTIMDQADLIVSFEQTFLKLVPAEKVVDFGSFFGCDLQDPWRNAEYPATLTTYRSCRDQMRKSLELHLGRLLNDERLRPQGHTEAE